MESVDLSRLQFAITALYHFLFVPLTLGLIVLVATMESIYVITRREIWKQMTKFWGLLFGINFAMGVATGITMEFQFGTNWAYYAHYVGDIFGVPLAIEGITAFFFEATFIGIFFFAWDKVSPRAHLTCTWLLAVGTSVSAFWILVANGWMQNPVGSAFNPDTMRMELRSMYDMIMNPTAQCKFVHTVNAGYVTGAIFMTVVSFYYLLRRKYIAIARRSLWLSSVFGLYAICSVVLLGDESGYTLGHSQKMKLAAIEGVWRAEKPPAGWTVFGFPSMKDRQTHYAFKIPYVLGLIATRSLDTVVLGVEDIAARGITRIKKGMEAYSALKAYQNNPNDTDARQKVIDGQKHLGYALLLKKRAPAVVDATEADIQMAAEDLIPNVPVLFWSFRAMVGSGLLMLLFFLLTFFWVRRDTIETKKFFLRIGMLILPFPWIASQCGWIISEYGRQPWAIDKILPTYYGASQLPYSFVLFTLAGFVVLYSVLLAVDIFLMCKYVRLGPDYLIEKKHVKA